MRRAAVFLACLACSAPAAAQDEWLERLDRSLSLEVASGLVRTDLSGLFDLEGYWIDRHPPGLLFGDGGDFLNPRLALFLDTHLARRFYSLVQARIDRGFDPRAESFSARADEYLLRYVPFEDGRLNLQVGKFATLVGNWVLRHDSWSNPLVNAPLPYEEVTTITDTKVPASVSAFLDRRRLLARKREWVPILWGPAYATGAAVFGRFRAVEYGLEAKNASVSSRPAVWDARSRGFSDPTVSGRVGVRPDPAWALGASLSRGPYLREEAQPTLRAGADADDFQQVLLGADASYAWRFLEIWSEGFLSRFEVPNVGDANAAAYYVEARLRVAPQLWAAGRWNQELFGEVNDGRGGRADWSHDLWRIDAALAYRFARHLQAKLQYSYTRRQGDADREENLGAAQITVRF